MSSQLPPGAQGHSRPSQHAPQLGHECRRRYSRTSLGKVGKQRIEDAGELCPPRMETVDDEILDHATKFMDKSKSEGKPFFLWLNPTRMHVITHLSEKYEKRRTPENNWSIEEAGMSQLDDIVGSVMQKVKDMGIDDNTILVFSTDNGTENFTWPDGGQTPFAGGKGTVMEGGFRAPAIIRWPGKVPAGKIENGLISGLDWFPTFVAAAGIPTSSRNSSSASSWATRHTRFTSTASTRLTLLLAKVQRSATRYSISRKPISVQCALGTLNIAFSINQTVGSGGRSRLTGRSS